MNKTAASLPRGASELEAVGRHAVPSPVVRPPRNNRLIIGLVKRVHLHEELFDPETLRFRSEKLQAVGRMANPHWYCQARDRFAMIRPD
jgi:hypothetical protein